jgi:PAS domain S-box-containing protein
VASDRGGDLAGACLRALEAVPDGAPAVDVLAAALQVLAASTGARGLQVRRVASDGRERVLAGSGPPVGVHAVEGRAGAVVVSVDGGAPGAADLSLLAGLLDVELRRRRSVGELTERLAELDAQQRAWRAVRSELSEATARLSSLVGTNALAIVALDHVGRVTLWNRGAEDLLGWGAEEVVGSMLLDLMPPDHSGLDLEAMRRALDEARAVGYFELRLRHRDGTYRELEGALSPILDEDGTVTGSSVIYRDVGARNEALRRLADNEEHFRLLADSSQDVVYRIGFEPAPTIEYVSPSAADKLGFTPAELVADPGLLGARVHPEDRGLLLVTSGLDDAPSSVRLRFRRADGRWRWLEDRRNPLVDADGRLIGVSGVLRDVTDEVESEQRLRLALEHERAAASQLRRSDEVKSRFLSAVSHELRTPLTSILGFAETAERSLVASDPDLPAVEYVRRIHANAQRLKQLIADLLDVERLARGPGDVHRERCELGALLVELAERADLGDRELELDVPGPSDAEVDAALVSRSVDNLLRNAGRHTPPGTHVALRLAVTSTLVSITVEDDGPGVPASARARILAPFEQGDEAASEPNPGTGIGLTLAHRFIRAQGGDLHVGERPGGGARFTIVLPRWEPASSPETGAKSPPAPAGTW